MPRKPSATVQIKLRAKEVLRRRIEQAAKKRGVSASYEMTSRLEQSFEQEASRSNEMIVEDMKVVWARYGQMFHELAKQGDLVRDAEALITAIEKGNPGSIASAVTQLKKAIEVIDIEAGIARRKMTVG
jgi:hypothetical protein